MNEEKNLNRQLADEDFRRSLTQLEDLLADETMLSPGSAIAPTTHSLNPTDANNAQIDPPHRFGGSLLDAIPLAQRLGTRLATQPITDPKSAMPNSSSTEIKQSESLLP